MGIHFNWCNYTQSYTNNIFTFVNLEELLYKALEIYIYYYTLKVRKRSEKDYLPSLIRYVTRA